MFKFIRHYSAEFCMADNRARNFGADKNLFYETFIFQRIFRSRYNSEAFSESLEAFLVSKILSA